MRPAVAESFFLNQHLLYEDLCEIGQLLLRNRPLTQLPGARRMSESVLPKQSLRIGTHQLCERAEKNMQASRALAAETQLLTHQTKALTDQAYASRRELGAVLSGIFWPAEVGQNQRWPPLGETVVDDEALRAG